jgi:hypothetical protein
MEKKVGQNINRAPSTVWLGFIKPTCRVIGVLPNSLHPVTSSPDILFTSDHLIGRDAERRSVEDSQHILDPRLQT